jgi:hypothetical protein
MSPDPFVSTAASTLRARAPETSPETSLEQMLRGFDGRPPPATAALALPWRVGRWLRTQGARRPMSLRIVNDQAMIVDGRILAVDRFGGIQDLSSTRGVVPAPHAHGQTHGQPLWKHR